MFVFIARTLALGTPPYFTFSACVGECGCGARASSWTPHYVLGLPDKKGRQECIICTIPYKSFCLGRSSHESPPPGRSCFVFVRGISLFRSLAFTFHERASLVPRCQLFFILFCFFSLVSCRAEILSISDMVKYPRGWTRRRGCLTMEKMRSRYRCM